MEPIHFSASLSDPGKPLPHFWEHTVGSGHASLALRADWQMQLRRCRTELGFRHARFHGILSEPMGTLVCECDELLYSFFNADQICDFLVSIGMKPFVELSFMPQALASGSQTVFHYRANVTPPKDLDQWSELVTKLAAHWIERYGIDEVTTWFFEVWNEPNLKAFWTGTQAEYFELYRRTAAALKAVDRRLRVGGPATVNNEWIPEFLAFCEKHGAPVDFVSTHHYPTDALGSIGEDTETQLAQSRRSILREWAEKSRGQARGKPLYYTEWNSSSNPRDHLHDEPYTAVVIIKTMLEARSLAAGYSFWTFTDIFEENFMPATAFQGGFGLLTLQGVAKPSYRAFELLHRLGTELLPVTGKHETVDAWAVRGRGAAVIMLTNHALPRHSIAAQSVHLSLESVLRPIRMEVERIDNTHANAKQRWIELGRPSHPQPEQVEELDAASRLVREPLPWTFEMGAIHFQLSIPPHGIAVITVGLTPDNC